MSLLTSEEENKCKEECEQKNDDEKMTTNESSKRKQDHIEEVAVEKKEQLFCSSSESDPDLEKTKNGSSKRRKKDTKQAPTQQKGVLFFSSSDADSDLEETKKASSKPVKIVKEENVERNEKDSDPVEMKTDVSKIECDDKGDDSPKKCSIKIKCSVMLDDNEPNRNSNSKRKPRKKTTKQQTLVNNKKKKMSSSSNDEWGVESIKSEESVVISSDDSPDSEIEEIKISDKLKPNKKIKSDHSENSNSMPSEEKKGESGVVCSDSDNDGKAVKEEEDYMKNIDKSLFPLFFVKEEEYEKRKKQKILRKMRKKEEEEEEEGEEEGERNVAQLRTRKQVKYYESSGAEDEDEDEEVEKVENDAGSEYDDVGSDSDFDPDEYRDDDDKSQKKETKTDEKKPKASQKKVESNANEKPKPMTDYEKMLEDKRVQNLELLKSIGLLEAKSDFLESVTSTRKKRQYTKKSAPTVKRVSARKKVLINYTEQARSQDSLIEKYNPAAVSFKKSLHISNIYEHFLKDFSEVVGEIDEDNIAMIPVHYNKKDLQQLNLGYTTSKSGYQTSSWYPSSENFILAVGAGTGGILSLWNISDENLTFYTFSVHSRSVSCLQFNHSFPSHLISSSRAGTLVLGDMEKLMFTKILDVSPEIHYFDFFSPHTYLVALRSGEIVIVDGRKHIEGHHKRHVCHESDINTVNMHPVMKSYFVTAGKDKTVRVWDLRKLSSEPVLQITNQQKEIFSAFFSPITGNSLLTTSRDATVRIFDCTSKTQRELNTAKVLKCVSNLDKLRGRRRAIWLPGSDDHFSINIEMLNVYDKHFNLYHTVEDGLKSNRSSHAFHPFRKALASLTDIRCCVAV